MSADFCNTMIDGMAAFAEKIERKKALYCSLLKEAKKQQSQDPFFRLTDGELFKQILQHFAISLDGSEAKHELSTIYEVGLHRATGTLLIANKGATLYSLSPRTETPSIARHIGCCLYVPGLGVEIINVGLSGDVYDGKIVLRSESACTPSFLFGSQRCNCAHQWETTRELAATLNQTSPPNIKDGRDFEQWVQKQFKYTNGKHLATTPGQGVVMMHVDTQNGMGSGFSAGEFSFDLFSRASLRHRGEYTAEQVHQTTMAGGFEAIGIRPDPRSADDGIGYKVTPVVLDWLGVSKDLIFLSNNLLKIKHLEQAGYKVQRVKSLGRVNPAGAQEAEERGTEFDHLDICATEVTFEQEMERLKLEISEHLDLSFKSDCTPPLSITVLEDAAYSPARQRSIKC